MCLRPCQVRYEKEGWLFSGFIIINANQMKCDVFIFYGIVPGYASYVYFLFII